MPLDPQKPDRYLRLNIEGHAHELTFSCYKRQPLIQVLNAEQELVKAVNSSRVKFNFDVWAYVFMPEHIHILIYPRDSEYSISRILKSIKQSSGRRVIHRCRRDNPAALDRLATGLKRPVFRFWQDGGGYDRNYWKPEEIRKQVDYIHANPVRRGLVAQPEDYTWSSARDWMNGEEGPIILERESFPM